MNLDKQQIMNHVISELLETKEVLKRQTQETRQASIMAEGPMQSRYDSMKSEMDWLSHGLALAGEKTRRYIEELQGLDLGTTDVVKAGAIVTVQYDGTEKSEVYFVIPGGSGIKKIGDDVEVTVIMPDSPIGKALLWKRTGDSFMAHVPVGEKSGIVKAVQ